MSVILTELGMKRETKPALKELNLGRSAQSSPRLSFVHATERKTVIFVLNMEPA